ncbi:hypothetical protein GBAR_LOCUS14113 [Geodia barretti]|uniref:Uncharacterized protein n=1 Tax=Geodia barretti TaxID=519541 RepID=A0AA35WJZ7_GEOBA|nr:hypothetical protein GBAR_LOCUS14113 [Geodia barretti]
MEVDILDGFSSTLRYLNGNCSWRVTTIAAGIEVEVEVSVGPQRTLVGGEGDTERFTLKCVTEEGEQLNAIIVTHTLETIPQPTIIALDYETGILDWSHPFHPDLPVDFEIIHQFRVVYLVNETDRDSGETMMSHESSLSVSRLLDHCRRQEFTVQTLVNDIFYSQSSSYLTNPSAPAFLTISPSLVVEDDTKVSVKVKFALEASVCISQFHVIIDGVVNISFNVTSPDRERGEVTYNLSPYLSSEGVCDVGGMVYGSNNIGESTQVQIPRGGSHCTPTGIITMPTLLSTTPTLTPPYSEDSVPGISVPVIITVSIISLFMIGTVTIIIITITRLLSYKKKGRGNSVVPPVSATCPDDVAPKVRSILLCCEVEPTTGAMETKNLSVEPTPEYVEIDHAATERVRQCRQGGADKLLSLEVCASSATTVHSIWLYYTQCM